MKTTRFIEAVTEFIFVQQPPEKADIIFVPGCARPEHALEAARLYHAGYAPLILPSGKYAKMAGRFAGVKEKWAATYPEAYDTEWAFLRDVLQKAGVPEEAILREDEATYTWDNAKKSRAVTDKLGLQVNTAILCCKPFHARRALMYYEAAFPATRFLVCPCPWPGSQRDDWFLTSKGRERVLGEVRRCGEQVGEVLAMTVAALEEEDHP